MHTEAPYDYICDYYSHVHRINAEYPDVANLPKQPAHGKKHRDIDNSNNQRITPGGFRECQDDRGGDDRESQPVKPVTNAASVREHDVVHDG